MIKLFGQMRYHWQPELSWAIIYWSLSLMPVFVALSLIYEKVRNPQLIFGMMALSLVLSLLGFHRYFVIDQDDLTIVSLRVFWPQKIAIKKIARIEISKYRFCLVTADGKRRVVFMRKWPKKYFLDALAIHPDFQGEVILNDNQTRLDYFKHYHKKTKP